jgi:DNA-binding transcriptional ArsR family regulator/SAM-dependent methyltransferase
MAAMVPAAPAPITTTRRILPSTIRGRTPEIAKKTSAAGKSPSTSAFGMGDASQDVDRSRKIDVLCEVTTRLPFPDRARAAALFHALSDETRLAVLEMLRGGEQCVCDLQAAVGAAQSRLSFHLKVLKSAGLVTDRRQGRWAYYTLHPDTLGQAHRFVHALGAHHNTEHPMANITEVVQARYGAAARRVLEVAEVPAAASCCAPASSCCGGDALPDAVDAITSNLYVNGEVDELPSAAVLASLGCGNPTALAELRAGEVVLDLGSGGGIDVLLSARRVGPTGKAFGLDMTDDMLALARRNAADAGVTNVEFIKGQIEAIPLPDASVDVIISNCVINLSGDKRQVLADAFRVLKPGGRFAVSDVVVRGTVPAALRRSRELWTGCVAGALEESEFRALLVEAGFIDVDIEPTRIYRGSDAQGFLATAGLGGQVGLEEIDGKFMAAFVRATKPAVARAGGA